MSRDEAMAEMFRDGESVRHIGAVFGISAPVVHRRIRRFVCALPAEQQPLYSRRPGRKRLPIPDSERGTYYKVRRELGPHEARRLWGIPA